MKLSDVKGERTLDVIADLIDPICNIVERDGFREILKREKLPEGADKRKAMVKRLHQFAPTLIRESKGDVISILSTIADKTPEEYTAEMTMTSLIRDLLDLDHDPEFVELFIQAQQQAEESSGAASENTEDR